jgi:hypothetical protein
MRSDKSNADTVAMPLVKVLSQPLGPDTGSARVQVDIAAQTHQGLVRSANEDHYLVICLERALETLLTSLPTHQVPARAEEVAYGLLVAGRRGRRGRGGDGQPTGPHHPGRPHPPHAGLDPER